MWASRGSLRIRCSVIYWLTGACIAWFTTMLGCCGAITKNKIMLIVVCTTPTSAGCNLHCASLEAYICYDYWSLFRIVLTATFMYQGTFCNCYKCNDCIVLRGCFFCGSTYAQWLLCIVSVFAVLMYNDCCVSCLCLQYLCAMIAVFLFMIIGSILCIVYRTQVSASVGNARPLVNLL